MARSRTPAPATKASMARSKMRTASTSEAKTATTASKGRASSSPPATARASVRMYRQGLGDCFLITLPKQDGSPWRMLIDCGVILGTKDANDRLSEVIANLVADTGGRVDVLVITHEHYDHIAAFAGLNRSFCAANETRKGDQLQVGEVWFAWSEDPEDPLGQKLNKARAAQVNRLAAMIGQLQSSEKMTPVMDGVAELMGFFGLGPDDLAAASTSQGGQGMRANGSGNGHPKHLGATAQAMENARALGGPNGEHVRYWKPDDMPWSSPELPGVRIYALGPPRDETMLKKTFATNEVYHLASSDAGYNAVFGAAALDGTGADGGDNWYPFDRAYGRDLHDPQQGGGSRMPDATAEFLQRHYYGPGSEMGDQDQSWRRIDQDWLGSAAQFALNLDSATNNTSLVLAIELSPGGEVLLFPADAQVGNWLSWQQVQWTVDANKTVTATDLLKRTAFYKVGHHGSHNATLREHGLELMPHGLAALLPVDHEMAVKKHWDGMPLPGLIDALKTREAAVVRMDDDHLPNDPRFRASAEQGVKFKGPLFYEWRLDQ